MPGGQERVLRRRIKSVQATQKITRAMELIAASQIVRAQSRLAAAAPYQHGLAEVLAEAAADVGAHAGRLLGVPADPRRILVLAMVSDRGLCGGYNTNVLRATERLVRAQAQVETRLVTVGRKAPPYLRFRRIEVDQSFIGFSDRPSFADARQVAEAVVPLFLDGTVDQVLVISTRFLSAGSQVVEQRQLLPLPEPGGAGPGEGENAEVPQPARREGYVEFEPEAEDLLADLVPRYAEAAIFGAMLEAAASEHTARQRAMAAATDNADELVKSLSRVMNRARQDAITTEIMEIVGGAEALRQSAEAQ
ncbi:MAG: ATP synthase F1 subunit gamma [Actinomycetota bacterium]|jgi:F-type H+-transporting ATPase subunit gamma|nr:ATP synthase F1 subunit gamma [Actinomycetota bacterium]